MTPSSLFPFLSSLSLGLIHDPGALYGQLTLLFGASLFLLYLIKRFL